VSEEVNAPESEAPRPSTPERITSLDAATGAAVRRPRLVLGTFWLVVGLAVLIGAFAPATTDKWGFLLGPLSILYAIYLYRGGRLGFFFF
jgi:hypothetical protein